ncbi:hypothetical protein GCM10020331_094730 [Ectobacillus funiculus]
MKVTTIINLLTTAWKNEKLQQKNQFVNDSLAILYITDYKRCCILFFYDNDCEYGEKNVLLQKNE